MFTPPDSHSTGAFVVICLVVLADLFWALKRSGQRVAPIALVVAVWLGLLSAAVASGAIETQPMPRAMVFLGLSNLMALYFGLSRQGGQIARSLPLSALVGFQAFRLPLELVLHRWVGQGSIPETMTWSGQNWDVVTGILAIALTPFVDKRPQLAWIFNAVGLALLLNVGRVAVLSSPFEFGWDVSPKLLLAFHMPYALIVPICVAGALCGHVILTRALLMRGGART